MWMWNPNFQIWCEFDIVLIWCEFDNFLIWCEFDNLFLCWISNFKDFQKWDLAIQRGSRPNKFTNKTYTPCFCDGHLFWGEPLHVLRIRRIHAGDGKRQFSPSAKTKWYDTCTFPESAHLKQSKSGSKMEFHFFLSKSRSRDLEGFAT